MQAHPVLEKLFVYLQEKGFSEDKIADIANELTEKSFLMLYTNAMAAFTEEDVIAIENCETDEIANKKIIELYALRTGKNPQEELNLFLKKVAEEFISQHNKELANKSNS